MKKKIMGLLIGIILLITAFPLQVKADHGPKPNTRVEFVNKSDEKFYATILYVRKSSTMFRAYDGTEESKSLPKDDERNLIAGWEAFIKYKDKDGYYFLQTVWNGAVEELYWGYNAPSPYKLLLYFPEYDYYAVSDILTKNNLDTVLRVDIAKVLESRNGSLTVSDISNSVSVRANDLIAFLGRVLFTFAVELGLALLFKINGKKPITLIVLTNLATQILLNLSLEAFIRSSGYSLGFIAVYMLLEILIFFIEMCVYLIFINRLSDKKHSRLKIAAYAFVANFASYVIGWIITFVVAISE